ncbi:MAG TPA: DUF3224 domain-containing protein [Terriglobales bacterium]|nr:DUF3224 domain-containing protein [Terriglobales bacterium]
MKSGIAIGTLCAVAGLAAAQINRKSNSEDKRVQQAKGTFEVRVVAANADSQARNLFSRMYLDKQFQGGLEGTSQVEMLSFRSEDKASGGYVAMEEVTGTLQGKTGSFILQQIGTMRNGVPELKVTVVPASGSGQLVGIDGTMTIRIENGTHFYQFDYTLPGDK